VSDAIASSFGYKDLLVEYVSLQYALYIPCFMCVLGGGFFLATALFLDSDRRKTDKAIKGFYLYVSSFNDIMVTNRNMVQYNEKG